MTLKLLYIDAVYPLEWLQQKQQELKLECLDFEAYRQWIIDQRIYLSDYITRNLAPHGFDCETLIVNDPVFISKLDRFLKGKKIGKAQPKTGSRLRELADMSPLKLYRQMRPSDQARRDRVVKKACAYFQPDVLFVREPTGIDTYFWNQFRDNALVAGLIGCNTAHPTNWLSHNFDVLYSLTDEYREFFNVQGIPSYHFSYGVDQRLYDKLSLIQEKKYDVTFVGLLGSAVQTSKTELMERIAADFSFSWWGPRNVDATLYPSLFASYQGRTSGIDMLTIYRKSKIVVNDYVDTANGKAVNLRLYEVLNTGSFLLTRAARNLTQQFGNEILSMYESNEDCLSKIRWYLEHEIEREEHARVASRFALDNFSYATQLKDVGVILKQHFLKKIQR